MNALAGKYSDSLNILAFPCNQFGHQTNENDDEFLNTLKHVRPGNGFEPAKEITVFEKVMVNGRDSHPLWRWMRAQQMIPFGETDVDSKGNGCADVEALILPREKFGGSTVALWTPVTRSDVAWNFEKFLLDKEGNVVKRFHRYHLIGDIAPDIDALM